MESNEFLTFTDCILTEWTGETHSFDAVERYVEEHPDKSVIVDIFPDTIVDIDKYYQVSVFYRKWVDRDISGTTYLGNEKKYLDFVNILWLYNTVDICYDLSFSNYFRKKEKRNKSFFKRFPMKMVQRDVKDWNVIAEVLKLALREAGHLWLYFKQWEMVAVICDVAIQFLFKAEQTIKKIRPLVESNSLYVQSVNKLNYD